MFAAEIRRKRVERMRSLPHWRWHLDEMFAKINSVTHVLWRAVDHEGKVLESFVSKKRDRKSALKFLKKTMKLHGRAHIYMTDKLRPYGAAMKEISNSDKQDTGHRKNNRAEKSHLPFRWRERAMQRFRRMRTLQKFVTVHSSIYNYFNAERALTGRSDFKLNRAATLAEWRGLLAA